MYFFVKDIENKSDFNNKIKTNKKSLKFIHISKNAGTSIEKSGLLKKHLWGMYHKEYGYWHQYFPLKKLHVKLNYNWFMIVRNPYDRILSEYYCEWGGIGKTNIKHTKDQMNTYLIEKIKKRNPYGDHYTEQHKYIEYSPNIIIFIIRFEYLDIEFHKLMDFYNIQNIELIKTNSSKEKNKTLSFTTFDFSNELITLINNVYYKDFELFNYTKRNIES